MSFNSLLIHTCDIGALTQGASDAYGNPVQTFPLSYTTKECRLMPTAGREVKVGAEVMISDWTLFIPSGVTVDEQDRISNILARSDGSTINSETFEILQVKFRSDSVSEQHKELLLRSVK